MGGSIFIALILYLALLFGVAYKIDLSKKWRKRIGGSGTVYALTLAVYCSAWTFFGSVGAASTYSLEFLTIYLGPLVATPFLWIVYRKIIRISRTQGISSMADFISTRYNKSIVLNRLVTVLLLVGIIPYIALQITGIERAVEICISWERTTITRTLFGYVDIALVISIGLGLFLVFFTTRHLQEQTRDRGLMGAIALESVVKLVVFIVFGIYICYFVFNSQTEVYQLLPESGLRINEANSYSQWFGMMLLSGLAFFFLPRQFEVGVFSIHNEAQLKKAIGLFPVYLILINLFVIPIALAGNHFFAGTNINKDAYMLALPLLHDHQWMALLVLLGGFSAASGMIIVSTHAISKMVANSILIPSFIDRPFVLKRFQGNDHKIPVFFRRISILLVLLAAYFYYKFVAIEYSLISIGLISFIAVAQFAPAILGGLFWRLGNERGALFGITGGFAIWFGMLVMPTLYGNPVGSAFHPVVDANPGSLITTVLFWSMFTNVVLYVSVSLFTKQSQLEKNQAELFVNIYSYSESIDARVAWKGKVLLLDIESLLTRFLGEQRARYELHSFATKNNIQLTEGGELNDPRLLNHAEKLLSNMIGSASARILVASVAKEDQISMEDVVDILEESQKLILLNHELNKTSQELKRISEALRLANKKLTDTDALKDEFLYTVTHELRTPLTSIKALTEILAEDEEMPEDTRKEFLRTIEKESNRMTRLISQVLDLENFESGKHQLVIEQVDFSELLRDCSQTMEEVFRRSGISFQLDLQAGIPPVQLDVDRITQVVLNLLANAVKYCDREAGKITLKAYQLDFSVRVDILDNGVGVAPEMRKIIFEKFFQAKNQTIRKPKGSGLGLAISKKIVQLHDGKIWVEENTPTGAIFSFTLPINQG